MNIEKLGNSEKLKFPFWVEGTFGDDIWWGGAGGPDCGGGSGGRRGHGREPDGTGNWGQGCQVARERGDDRRQEGQMTVVGGWWVGQ